MFGEQQAFLRPAKYAEKAAKNGDADGVALARQALNERGIFATKNMRRRVEAAEAEIQSQKVKERIRLQYEMLRGPQYV